MQNCQAHYLWHHAGPADKRNIRTLKRIVDLRGPEYERDLLLKELNMPKHDLLYLMALKEIFKARLKEIE
jgi:hypothetical protein